MARSAFEMERPMSDRTISHTDALREKEQWLAKEREAFEKEIGRLNELNLPPEPQIIQGASREAEAELESVRTGTGPAVEIDGRVRAVDGTVIGQAPPSQQPASQSLEQESQDPQLAVYHSANRDTPVSEPQIAGQTQQEDDSAEFSRQGQEYLKELAEKANRIFDTETGPHRNAELRGVWDRNELEMSGAFDKVCPEGTEMKVDDYDRFQAFYAQSIEAIGHPKEFLERSKDPPSLERTDQVVERESKDGFKERAGQDAELSDYARAIEREHEQARGREGPGMSMDGM
jgi:hypothetical protein